MVSYKVLHVMQDRCRLVGEAYIFGKTAGNRPLRDAEVVEVEAFALVAERRRLACLVLDNGRASSLLKRPSR